MLCIAATWTAPVKCSIVASNAMLSHTGWTFVWTIIPVKTPTRFLLSNGLTPSFTAPLSLHSSNGTTGKSVQKAMRHDARTRTHPHSRHRSERCFRSDLIGQNGSRACSEAQSRYIAGLALLERIVTADTTATVCRALSDHDKQFLHHACDGLQLRLPWFQEQARTLSLPTDALPLNVDWLITCGVTWNQPHHVADDSEIEESIRKTKGCLQALGAPAFVTVARSVDDRFTAAEHASKIRDELHGMFQDLWPQQWEDAH
eukprot:TRINITY_DN11607_c0_g1_i2.p1 TRINITY_DN11607_c0_g1~~TRINITY_DN11607_c0_g1_i2.p1  ORF type:complete len:259 (+),score=17.60 TRINITY_DN11607_c0_g1_i2:564-1340(+)